MEFGIVLRQPSSWEDMRAAAVAADDAGFDSVWVVDHLVGVRPGDGILEAWTVLAALAASTSRVGIGAQVLCQSFRSPSLLAKMATTLDLVSGGRLRFLIGTGWKAGEYEAFGYPFPPPGRRVAELAEAVTILRGMWDSGGQPFTATGEYYRVTDVRNLPAPSRRIPLGIGGVGPRMIRLAARVADEWNCTASALPDYDRLRQIADDASAGHGRRLRRSLHLGYAPGKADVSTVDRFHPELGLRGSVQQMVDRVGELAAAGVDGIYGIPADRRAAEAIAAALPQLRAAAAKG